MTMRKTAISLPEDQLRRLKAAEAAGRIPSVSGHIQELLRRDEETAEVAETLRRLFGEETPGGEHRAWAERVLGLDVA
jgi:Arc/MetJ-type ribon-helix-helix transcriptional regulator